MRLQPECRPCILTMADTLIGRLPLSAQNASELRAAVRELPALQNGDAATTSPEVIETVMRLMTRATGLRDPFADEKRAMNTGAAALAEALAERVRQAPNPLAVALQLSALGNHIDFMLPGGAAGIEAHLQAELENGIDPSAVASLAARLDAARSLVFFCDNCGEIVFDRLLLNELRRRYPDLEVHVVVRSEPTLNDATLTEAEAVGLDRVARLIPNGIDGPLPGTVIARCSPEVQRLVARADLLIAKGGGNFDTLDEERGRLPTAISFLLLTKCAPHTAFFKTRRFRPVIFNAWGHLEADT